MIVHIRVSMLVHGRTLTPMRYANTHAHVHAYARINATPHTPTPIPRTHIRGGAEDPSTAVYEQLVSRMWRGKVSILDGGFRACVQVTAAPLHMRSHAH